MADRAVLRGRGLGDLVLAWGDGKARFPRVDGRSARAWALGGALLGPGFRGMRPTTFRVVVPILVDKRISWLRGSCPLQADSHRENDSLEFGRQPALVKEPATLQVS